MKNLTIYVERVNAMNAIFKQPQIDLTNVTEEVAQDLFDRLDGDLSPENLCCDGELPRAQVQAKAKLFHAAGKELLAMGFKPNSTWSEFA